MLARNFSLGILAPIRTATLDVAIDWVLPFRIRSIHRVQPRKRVEQFIAEDPLT